MQIDHLLGRQIVCLANIREIRTILSAIANRDFPMGMLGQSYLVKAVEIRIKKGFKLSVAQFERIELDQDRAIGRMKIVDAANRLLLQSANQFNDTLMAR